MTKTKYSMQWFNQKKYYNNLKEMEYKLQIAFGAHFFQMKKLSIQCNVLTNK